MTSFSPGFPPAVELEVFIRREDAKRFVEEVRGDDPELAGYLRIEERELEAGGLLTERCAGLGVRLGKCAVVAVVRTRACSSLSGVGATSRVRDRDAVCSRSGTRGNLNEESASVVQARIAGADLERQTVRDEMYVRRSQVGRLLQRAIRGAVADDLGCI